MSEQPPESSLQERLSEVSRKKAHLELINRMLIRLTEVSGLDNMVGHIIDILMETIGASNISLYYFVDETLMYRDALGAGGVAQLSEDAVLAEVAASRSPRRITAHQSSLAAPGGNAASACPESWYFPLIARGRVVGVVAMIEMYLTDETIWREIQPFFVYGALMLDNEITNYSQLAESHARLKESEERFRTLFEESPFGVLLVDPATFRVIHVNARACKTLGYTREELGALRIQDLEAIEDSEAIEARAAALEGGENVVFESVHRAKNGEPRNVIVNARSIVVSGRPMIQSIVQDITEAKKAEEERKKLERQLLHAQKLESLGVLAGGIAHDFNNILMAVMGNADLALMRLSPESPAVENIRNIERATARAADLAKQMLAYSGKGKFVVESLNLNRLLEEMLHMLQVSISKKAVLRLNLSESLPAVEADATQLRQVVMNLVINASEAIGDKSGVIAITTGCLDCDHRYLDGMWMNENLAEGLYVFLEVADTGCGMDRDTLARLFDPFFTTKFTGRGLGMAAVLGIVRGHRGGIKVYSEPGQGTTFKVLFPAGARPAELFDARSGQDDWKGTGTVLLVDDEETVRGIGAEMLRVLGFSVLTACDGVDAVRVFRGHPEIALVILDLTMPHMDGEHCFRELRQLRPGVKVVMSSGYNQQEVTQKFIGKGLAGFVQKPYRLSALRDAMKSVCAPA